MLTFAVFRREHIFSEFGSLNLNGPDILSACFDPLADVRDSAEGSQLDESEAISDIEIDGAARDVAPQSRSISLCPP